MPTTTYILVRDESRDGSIDQIECLSTDLRVLRDWLGQSVVLEAKSAAEAAIDLGMFRVLLFDGPSRERVEEYVPIFNGSDDDPAWSIDFYRKDGLSTEKVG